LMSQEEVVILVAAVIQTEPAVMIHLVVAD
jgi:hypothetical protein